MEWIFTSSSRNICTRKFGIEFVLHDIHSMGEVTGAMHIVHLVVYLQRGRSWAGWHCCCTNAGHILQYMLWWFTWYNIKLDYNIIIGVYFQIWRSLAGWQWCCTNPGHLHFFSLCPADEALIGQHQAVKIGGVSLLVFVIQWTLLAKHRCSSVTDWNQRSVVRKSQNRKRCIHLFRQTRSSNLRNQELNQRAGRSQSRLKIRCDDRDVVKIWLY